jgi:hypothetical protein
VKSRNHTEGTEVREGHEGFWMSLEGSCLQLLGVASNAPPTGTGTVDDPQHGLREGSKLHRLPACILIRAG